MFFDVVYCSIIVATVNECYLIVCLFNGAAIVNLWNNDGKRCNSPTVFAIW